MLSRPNHVWEPIYTFLGHGEDNRTRHRTLKVEMATRDTDSIAPKVASCSSIMPRSHREMCSQCARSIIVEHDATLSTILNAHVPPLTEYSFPYRQFDAIVNCGAFFNHNVALFIFQLTSFAPYYGYYPIPHRILLTPCPLHSHITKQ